MQKLISKSFTFFLQEVVSFKNSCIFARATIVNNNWPVRLSARTPGFHPGKRGSIPLRATKLKIMANHKSAIKRIRSSEVKKQRNRYQHKTARTAMKKFFEINKKKQAEKELPLLISMIDKLAKNNIIHDNKAANLKANFAKHVSSLKK